MREHDPSLRRIERNSVAACGLFAVAAWIVSEQVASAVGVMVGTSLVAFSYWMIKGSVSRLGTSPAGRPMAIGWFVVRILGRYALLAGIAYVTIARLHLPPLALLAGVSAIVVGVELEGFRALVGRQVPS